MENSSPEITFNMKALNMSFCCVSVPGGWQTAVTKTGYPFGPVFNDVEDLWNWQKVNLYGGE